MSGTLYLLITLRNKIKKAYPGVAKDKLFNIEPV